MFFDMHADLWTDNLWEYEKGKNDVIRRKYKDRFIEGGVFGGIFVIYLNTFKDPKPEETFFRSHKRCSYRRKYGNYSHYSGNSIRNRY